MDKESYFILEEKPTPLWCYPNKQTKPSMNPKGSTDMAKKLYTWKDENGLDVFGHYLATNSDGKKVMEVKGTGSVVVLHKDAVQEVFPYTVTVKFLGGDGHEYSYLAAKDKFAVNDLLLVDAAYGLALAVITDIDTKSAAATKELNVVGKVIVDKDV